MATGLLRNSVSMAAILRDSKAISRLMALVGRLGHDEFDPLALQLLEIRIVDGCGGGLELRRSDQLFTGGLDESAGLTGFGWEN